MEVRKPPALPAEAAPLIAPIEGVATTRVRELVAMAQAGPGQSRIVELKAVEPGYPFYGALVTDPVRPLDTLIGGGRALVHDSLLARLGLRVGDRFRVGDLELTHHRRHLKEPDRAVGVFSLGPRVLIAAEDLDRTGLVRPGSRVRHRTLVRLPEGGDAQASATARRGGARTRLRVRPTRRPSPVSAASGTSSRCTSASPGSWRSWWAASASR